MHCALASCALSVACALAVLHSIVLPSSIQSSLHAPSHSALSKRRLERTLSELHLDIQLHLDRTCRKPHPPKRRSLAIYIIVESTHLLGLQTCHTYLSFVPVIHVYILVIHTCHSYLSFIFVIHFYTFSLIHTHSSTENWWDGCNSTRRAPSTIPSRR